MSRRSARVSLAGAVLLFCFAPACRPPDAGAPDAGKEGQRDGPVGAPSHERLALRDYPADPIVVAEGEADAGPGRIVSLAPTVTEMCAALRLADRLVGRTSYCNYPPRVTSVPEVGALTDLNVESLVRLQPDLILVAGRSLSQTDVLARLGLRFESIPDTSLDDLYAGIRKIGTLTGQTAAAETLCSALRGDIEAVRERYGDVPRRRVLLLTATLSDPPSPPHVAGPGSFYDELLRLAGHENAAAEMERAFAPLSIEYILRTDPDVIIELDADGRARPGGEAQARAVWAKIGPLRAVEERRVRVLSGSQHYLLGPRVALTFRDICAAIAGEHR